MKIGFFSDWWLPTIGGTERHMAELGAYLQERGHEVVVIYSVPSDCKWPARETIGGLPTIRVRFESPPMQEAERCGHSMRDAFQLADIMGELFPDGLDVLHAHSRWMAFRCLLAGPMVRLPVIVSLHVTWPLTPAVA